MSNLPALRTRMSELGRKSAAVKSAGEVRRVARERQEGRASEEGARRGMTANGRGDVGAYARPRGLIAVPKRPNSEAKNSWRLNDMLESSRP
jgi:hypothetical protein